jgi:RNA polymerase sigma-70 factor (ECF subfamily)
VVVLTIPIQEAVRGQVSQIAGISVLSDERALIAAAKAGDQHAYGQLLERHQAVAFRAACLITGSAAEAEDATQDACIKAWLALARFRPDAPFRPWLVRIAINEARNRRRGAGRRTALALRLGPQAGGGSSTPSAETEALAGEERAQLASAVGRLSEADQLVVAARYFLGLSEAETAVALGWRRGTVKSRLSRALGRLQTELETAG